MNQQSFGQKTGPETKAGPGAGPAGSAAPGGQTGNPSGTVNPVAGKDANQAVTGPFTVRDLAVFAATLVMFVASLLPIFGGLNLWNLNNLFFLGLGIVLPLGVSALFASRRLAPTTRIRVGSLSIDQFASVVASFAVAFFFLAAASSYAPVFLVGLIGALILFAATVLGRFLPYISADFKGRAEAPAHVVAREAAVPVQKPRTPKAPKPEAVTKTGTGSTTAGATPAGSTTPGLGGKVFGGSGSGSSAVPAAGSSNGPAAAAAAGAAAPAAPAASTGATAGSIGASSAAAAGSAASVPSASGTAAQAGRTSGDSGPATQAADVVRPAAATADEPHHHGSAAANASAAPATGVLPASTPAAAGSSAPGDPAGQRTEPPAATAVHQQVRRDEPIGATVDPANRPEEQDDQPAHEAFWFAVAQHRTAFDPRSGEPAFVIEPGGWVLALEDRGNEFLVQHTDGRLGILRDLSNIERG
ncbi:hypothetical protein ACU18_02680 [Arthrobacter sp. ZBG10]|uniref:hypothetical protein n=1 Tax=Arthrobacter sp. ZBG10 TaxID=1676590 RepID=UPI0006812B38|nr:hypothetical protein [Arthrobacter sp. ZBG10]KNH21622.1 hypothetical protein ACU18_02680 [Arthrobacter sp. ZBG10]